MKRVFLLIVLVMVVSWLVASYRSPSRRPGATTRHWTAERHGREDDAGHRRIADETRRKTRRVLAEAGDEIRQALDEARDEVRQAYEEARGDVHQALDELRASLDSGDDRSAASPPICPPSPVANEAAEGLPVPIVPGTRVTEAKVAPPASRTSSAKAPLAVSTQSACSTVTGRLSANRERAVADARRIMQDNLASWLDPDVPRSWAPPVRMLDAMVVGKPRVRSIEKPYGEVFEATLTIDMSPQRRTALIEVYNRQLVERRLISLGGSLAFILICLAALSGYIRADEATKGYYTNRLRMLAAAGVGASGVILYHMVV